jgi:hypothetical protein
MFLTEFFNSPEGDSYADYQATSTTTKEKRLQATTTNEHIEKVSGGYRLVSKKSHKNLGTYPTKASAEKRERQVQYFKHMSEDNHMSDVVTARQLAKAAINNPQTRQKYFDFLKHLREKHGKEYSTQVHQHATNLDEDQWSGPNNAWHNEGDDQWSDGRGQWTESTNGIDSISVDIPLLIRLLEYAREDAKTDMDLHNVAERLTALSQNGRTLNMDDYNKICNTKEQ